MRPGHVYALMLICWASRLWVKIYDFKKRRNFRLRYRSKLVQMSIWNQLQRIEHLSWLSCFASFAGCTARCGRNRKEVLCYLAATDNQRIPNDPSRGLRKPRTRSWTLSRLAEWKPLDLWQFRPGVELGLRCIQLSRIKLMPPQERQSIPIYDRNRPSTKLKLAGYRLETRFQPELKTIFIARIHNNSAWNLCRFKPKRSATMRPTAWPSDEIWFTINAGSSSLYGISVFFYRFHGNTSTRSVMAVLLLQTKEQFLLSKKPRKQVQMVAGTTLPKRERLKLSTCELSYTSDSQLSSSFFILPDYLYILDIDSNWPSR